MNSFGRIFRVQIFGESHGDSVGVIIDGCPAGISINEIEFEYELNRRKSGTKGTTKRTEEDRPIFKSGIFEEKTTGTPILIEFENRDVRSKDYSKYKVIPRPGHVDFVAMKKYGGFNDYRGAGHFSGRLTVGLVAAGAIAKKIIEPLEIKANLLEVGGSRNIDNAVTKAIGEKDSIGGIIECRVNNVPVGLGEPFFDSVESLISHAIFSIPAIKAIEFGAGFECAKMRGSEFNDEIINTEGKTKTNNSGGINGGITNGNEIYFRVAVRPTPSISKPQKSINMKTGEQVDLTITGRHDVCIALRMPVIIESAVAIVLADLLMIEQEVPRVLNT